MPQETFWDLLFSAAHWELELFIMFIVDGLLGILVWPRVKRWWKHHRGDDAKIDKLERRVEKLRIAAGLDPFTDDEDEGT